MAAGPAPASPAPGGRSGFLEAALAVLREAGEPLTAAEITRRALEKGLIRTAGKTPEATMSARLYTLIQAQGDASPVIRLATPGRQRAVRGSVRWALRP